MKTGTAIIFTALTLSVTTVYGQTYEPLELAKEIFGTKPLPHIERYISGEYNGQPNGQDLQDGSTAKFTLLGQTDNTAVVGMTVLDAQGKGADAYLHFEKDASWRMTAFRALAMTGMIEEMKIGLEQMTPQQVDATIELSNKAFKEYDFRPFKSREEYNFLLGNAKLILELDDNIIKHFQANQNEFEHLKNLALIQLERPEGTELLENSKSDYKKLFISSVSIDEALGNGINFLIGGMLDNSVGYLYVKDKKDLPEMSPELLIMIKEIGNGWYIYKKT
jgi:hypothetical protein